MLKIKKSTEFVIESKKIRSKIGDNSMSDDGKITNQKNFIKRKNQTITAKSKNLIRLKNQDFSSNFKNIEIGSGFFTPGVALM